jgi:hypothetical protein
VPEGSGVSNTVSTRPIAAIKIGERHRKDFGDLASLARAIDRESLLQGDRRGTEINPMTTGQH